MSATTVIRLSALLVPLSALVSARSVPPASPATIRLSVATLHAAALTAPAAAAGSVNGPYFLVSILGPHAKTATVHLPETGHLRIHLDEALGARPLTDLSLQPGDSVRVLVSVLEGTVVHATAEATAATASGAALLQPATARIGTLTSALAPVTSAGARWLGSAMLLLTNENGIIWWRAFECVATCKVLNGGAATTFPQAGEDPVAGVVELSGNGGTYHMQLYPLIARLRLPKRSARASTVGQDAQKANNTHFAASSW